MQEQRNQGAHQPPPWLLGWGGRSLSRKAKEVLGTRLSFQSKGSMSRVVIMNVEQCKEQQWLRSG